MCSKSVGPTLELWLTATLTDYSSKEFSSKTTSGCLILGKDNIRLNKCHTTWVCCEKSMPSSAEYLGCIKWYSSISSRPIERPRKSIKCNCQEIGNWLKRPQFVLEIVKKATFLEVINHTYYLKILLTTERRLAGW